MHSRYLAVIALLPVALSTPIFKKLVLHEERLTIPHGFLQSGPAPDDQILELRIALVHSDIEGLEETLYAVSTPDSDTYGQHLSKEDVEEYVKPSKKSTSLVKKWLKSNGLKASRVTPTGDWISVSMPVSKANKLLAARYTVFNHEKTGTQITRTLSYSIPVALVEHLDLVHPTISFENPSAGRPLITSPLPLTSAGLNFTLPNGTSIPCNEAIVPACLQQLYGIPTASANQSSNVLGVLGYLKQYPNRDDLATFLTAFRPDMSNTTTFDLETLDGGKDPQQESKAGDEANLDIQYTVGTATGVPTTFFSVGDHYKDGHLQGFLDIVSFLLKQERPPSVLTTSYGQDENSISRKLANKLCQAQMQLGARGTSVLFSSGDGGVAGSDYSLLGSPDSCTTFVPTFPAGCPFITSVGATSGVPEAAANFSSGGFSNYFSQPSYQSSAVASYLDAYGNATNAGRFNRTGRGYPDVSAQGVNVVIVLDQEPQSMLGTSCSSPIFASVIALLNDELMSAGKSTLGFLNPFLYTKGASALNAITSGANVGCNVTGFPAREGWSPVTGLGTPNFEKLRATLGL